MFVQNYDSFVNNNAYQLDLFEDYGVHATFNVIYLKPFVGSTYNEAQDSNLRINHLQEGGDDGRYPNRGPTTRAMARTIQEE